MSAREDVRIDIAGETLGGWLYRPSDRATSTPCVVMAHGFGALKEARLDAFAERFAGAGYAVLVFDYRHFGESTGKPRNLVNIGRQHDDWGAAIAYARSLDGVDPERIVLWGRRSQAATCWHLEPATTASRRSSPRFRTPTGLRPCAPRGQYGWRR